MSSVYGGFIEDDSADYKLQYRRLQHQTQHERFSSYLHLAWSIVGDLRLDRVSEAHPYYSRMAMSKVSSDQNSSRHSVNERRRALIGCYMLSSWSVITSMWPIFY